MTVLCLLNTVVSRCERHNAASLHNPHGSVQVVSVTRVLRAVSMRVVLTAVLVFFSGALNHCWLAQGLAA